MGVIDYCRQFTWKEMVHALESNRGGRASAGVQSEAYVALISQAKSLGCVSDDIPYASFMSLPTIAS